MRSFLYLYNSMVYVLQQRDFLFRHPEINALTPSPVQVCFLVTYIPTVVTAGVGMAARQSSDVWPAGV